MNRIGTAACSTLLIVLVGCSQSDQEKAQDRAAEAKVKAREDEARLNQDAKKLGQEVKQEARVLDQKVNGALNNPGPSGNGPAQAEEKLARGGRELEVETGKAEVKLDRAALIAQVKAKLAANVGLSTVTGIDVDTSGHVITLRGTVGSVQQKQQAEQSAMQVAGVTKVIDQLNVQP